MFCPRCGVTQLEEREHCGRCAAVLARPQTRPLPPIRVVAAPTRRGELAQRAAGLVIAPRPQRRDDLAPVRPVPSDPTAALGAPVAGPHPGSFPVPAGPATTDGPGVVAPSPDAAATPADSSEPRPGEPGWPPPPGPWQPPAAPGQAPPDRRGSGWAPRPNGTD